MKKMKRGSSFMCGVLRAMQAGGEVSEPEWQIDAA